jgi:CRP-like cAMP-binding protein
VPLSSGLVQQVPLFSGFTPQELRQFLDASTVSTHRAGEVLWEVGSASNCLLVLLDGEVEMCTPQGTAVAGVRPISAIGETGFVNRTPRTATARAVADSRLLRAGYYEFEALAERLPGLRAKLYRNVVRILADRLADAHDLIARYRQVQESVSPARPGDGRARRGAAAHAPTDAPDEDAEADRLVAQFYPLVDIEPTPEQRLADRDVVLQLRRDGYTHADIEYAAKWAVRNIPSIRRFGLVRLSIREAFQDRWTG